MDTPVDRVAGQRPLERFRPTTGTFVGFAGLLLAAAAVLYVAVYEHSSTGLRIATAAVFGSVVIWLTQLRPRVTAYPGTLVMRGSVRDAYLPLAAIDEVMMGQTLNVYVGGKRYVCVGIGRSIGTDKEPGTSYHSFVLDRITDLVSEAMSASDAVREEQVAHRYAVVEIAALVVTGLVLLASLLV